MLKIEFKDEIYPFNGIDNIRYISRGFILDEENRLSILSVSRDDIFGKLSYIESSGGGIDEGENEDQAIIREIEEETGYKVSIIKKIGVVTDYYNLINRKNIQYYYLLKKGEYVGKHFVSLGDQDIKGVRFLPINELINEYSKYLDNKNISFLVARKEILILKEIEKELKAKVTQ